MEMIDNHEFFYTGKWREWIITEDMINCINELNATFYKGSYVDKGIRYSYEENLDIIEKYSSSPEIFFNNISITMQLILLMLNFEELSNTLSIDIKYYDLILIKSLYISEDSNGDIITNDKRPFGNSYMIGDVNLYVTNSYMIGDVMNAVVYSKKNITESECHEIYNRILDIVILIFRNLKPKYRRYVFHHNILTPLQEKYLRRNWTIDIIEQRNDIIDSIIE